MTQPYKFLTQTPRRLVVSQGSLNYVSKNDTNFESGGRKVVAQLNKVGKGANAAIFERSQKKKKKKERQKRNSEGAKGERGEGRKNDTSLLPTP
jgi:hypothetical protein